MFKKMKLALSKTFRIKGRDVKGEIYHKGDTTGFNVSLVNSKMDLKDLPGLLTPDDKVHCKVFDTYVSTCSLEPKMPACTGCPLNT